MNDLIETIEYKGHNIDVYQDTDPINPREWDSLGTMMCWHRHYDLGDKQPRVNPIDYMLDVLNHEQQLANDYEDIPEDKIEKMFNKIAVVLPLYIYDHSGITMNTRGFSCPWDSGQVGFIYILKKKMMEEFGRKKWSKSLNDRAIKIMQNEVSVYDDYLTGNVYGYRIESTDDSCWGYYGKEGYDYMVEECKGLIDLFATKEQEKQYEAVASITGMED